jgi:hypothetical protein
MTACIGGRKMAHWIYIEEGTYVVDAAFLFTSAHMAAPLEDAVMEVYLDGTQERRVRGSGLAVSAQIVELLEDHDDIDLLIDLGDEFRYILRSPVIRSGKALAPDVKSLMQFVAQGPLQRLSNDEYADIRSRMTLIEPKADPA